MSDKHFIGIALMFALLTIHGCMMSVITHQSLKTELHELRQEIRQQSTASAESAAQRERGE